MQQEQGDPHSGRRAKLPERQDQRPRKTVSATQQNASSDQ